MKNDNLSVYLNDHLAGSVAALELIGHLIKATADTEFELFFKDLFLEIKKDQSTLEELMASLNISQSGFRKASAWLMEKASLVKLGPDLNKDGNFGLFQAVEALVLGITGKKKLWKALEEVIPPDSIPAGFDFPSLEKRAGAQINRVEEIRLALARTALRA